MQEITEYLGIIHNRQRKQICLGCLPLSLLSHNEAIQINSLLDSLDSTILLPTLLSLSIPCSGVERRHHINQKLLQQTITKVFVTTDIVKLTVLQHFFRHIFCYLAPTFRELLDHSDVSITTIHTHILNRGGKIFKSH